MGPQELINERNRLFESLKSYFSRQAKTSTITFAFFACLLDCVYSVQLPGIWTGYPVLHVVLFS